MKKLLVAFLATLLACACTDWQGTGTKPADLEWGTASLCRETPIAPGETLCYQISFKLDTLAGESELSSLLAAVIRDSVLCTPGRSTIGEAMADLADSIEAEWKTDLAERYEPESEYKDMYQYNYTLEGSRTEVSADSILSYRTILDCYLGGAHGSHVVQYYNFNVESGKLLNIGDVVPTEKTQEVLKAMEEQLCKDWEAQNLADLQEKTGITMLGDLYLTNNFLLTGDSIMFLFNQYEIAPYAAGLISVTIPLPTNR